MSAPMTPLPQPATTATRGLVRQTVYNVRDFGAVGDGATDDTAAIAAAIVAAHTAGGGTVYLPTATYSIAPTATVWLPLYSNITLRGDGAASVIQVKANAGNYFAVFSPALGLATISNVLICDLRIDQNANANTTSNIAIGNNAIAQYAVYSGILGSYLRVHRCVFDSCCGINTVVFGGATHIQVIDNSFTFVMRAGNADYDNSTIYLNTAHWVVSGNTFKGPTPGATHAARGAIEVHGGPGSIVGNVVVNYQTLTNIVPSSYGTGQITVSGNSLLNGNSGISLWPLTGYVLEDVTITGNTIVLAQQNFTSNNSSGILLIDDASSTGLAKNIVITGNTVRFGDEGAGRAIGSPGDNTGIGAVNQGGVLGLVIANNVIELAPVRAITVGQTTGTPTFSHLLISNNVIINPGQNLSVNAGYRYGIAVWSNITDCIVSGNQITDTFATTRCQGGVWTFASTTLTGLRVFGNSNTSTTTAFHDLLDAATLGGFGVNAFPWLSGDTAPTLTVGSSAAGMNQIAVLAQSDTGPGLQARTNSGTAPIQAISTDTGTNNVLSGLYLSHRTTGTPVANFGTAIQMYAQDSTTLDITQARIVTTWVVPTHGAQTARMLLYVYDTAPREALRLEASGTAPMVGFYGHAAAAQPTVSGALNGNAALSSLVAALASQGLVVNSTAGDTTSSANTVLAGPTSGGAVAPTFRALVAGDLAAVNPSALTGSGTLPDAALPNEVAAGTTANPASITVDSKGRITAISGGGGGAGTVTSVAMTVPAILSIAGSPISTSGTLAVTLATQTANQIFAGPSSGSAAAPTFRALVAADLPADVAYLDAATSAFTGLITQTVTNAATNTSTLMATFAHRSSNPAAAAFGSLLKLALDSSANTLRDAAAIGAIWSTATDGAQISQLLLQATGTTANTLTTRMTLAGTGGSTIPWVSGDTGNTLTVGATTTGMNRTALIAQSDSSVAVLAQTNSGTAPIQSITSDAGTATVTDGLYVSHRTTGTPVANFGSALILRAQDSTTTDIAQARIVTQWIVPTHASQTARLTLFVYDTLAREGLRLEASGSAPMVGFYGHAAQTQQASAATASDAASTQTLANSLKTILTNLGLCT